jgi:ribosomal subunit interface protein
MQVQVHYHGMEASPWVDQFVERRLEKLERYLNPSSSILVNLKFEDRKFTSTLAIHHFSKDYAFSADGENLYESFSQSVEKASRSLSEKKKKLKDKIHRRFYSLKKREGLVA